MNIRKEEGNVRVKRGVVMVKGGGLNGGGYVRWWKPLPCASESSFQSREAVLLNLWGLAAVSCTGEANKYSKRLKGLSDTTRSKLCSPHKPMEVMGFRAQWCRCRVVSERPLKRNWDRQALVLASDSVHYKNCWDYTSITLLHYSNTYGQIMLNCVPYVVCDISILLFTEIIWHFES